MSAVCFKKRWGRVEAGNKDETLAVADNYWSWDGYTKVYFAIFSMVYIWNFPQKKLLKRQNAANFTHHWNYCISQIQTLIGLPPFHKFKHK